MITDKDMQSNQAKITFLRDSDWSVVDGEPCRVINFVPLGSIRVGKVATRDKTKPYASITLECKKLSDNVTGYITHKMDFEHLWIAFKERTVKPDEEVIIFWSKKRLKGYARILSAFMPRLWVMMCSKGAFELMTDSNWKPELSGEARWNAIKPRVEWKPEVTSSAP